ncbi:major capsid protein [Desulfovibrio litoralis]|uniref:Uncharacterized protein n=1 Tax=Desulfovibrio litoralis DSM 11393 TaxID=1121455 RepID=A0A1M7SWS9_9BACT|nr:hypothetical protein [Desulfovibrio litoralis]SHN62911.1 hypothetical protein SAMN02745728_01315 [Desulfovibrio litoralis DSM 11393]
MGETLKNLATRFARKQPQQVDQLTEEAPILGVIPFEPASHDLWNMYEDVEDITGAGWVEMNAPLPELELSSTLKKVDLAILGGEIECPEDTANLFGGKEAYFSKKLPKIIRKSGMSAEQRIIYDNFRAFAVQNKKAFSAGGTGLGNSILAVRFVSGETCGLYGPQCFNQGTLLNTQSLNGGDLYKSTNPARNGVLVYGLRLKSYLGIQIGNKNSVSALVNITASSIPTATMIDDMLAEVRATPGSTYLFMHEKTRNMLCKYKADSLHISSGSKDVDRMITHWNGIEIVTSYNFLDNAEKAVTL